MRVLLIVFASFLIAACNNQEEQKFTVEGTYIHAAGKKIMLAELPFNQPQRLVLDSATLDSTGKFKLSTLQTQEGLYQLFVGNDPGILLVNDTTDILLHANADSLGFYKLENSPASGSIKTLYERMTVLEKKAATSNIQLDSINKTKTPDSLKSPYIRTAERNNKAVADFLIAWLRNEKNATAQWYGLGVANHFLTREQWAAAMEKAVAAHPRHAGLSLMKLTLAAAEQDAASGKALLGKQVPDITLADTSGKPLSVSSFKRKWLLVDFWASWCAPCRAENPNLVAINKQFRNKNFAILSVSLDRDTAAWKNAIRKDSLSWAQMSDLKFWESKAVDVYGFAALPFNILVDTSGKAVAVNLHGEALKAKLGELVK
jgi:thiol-disulfide isomerase/thioredoxin